VWSSFYVVTRGWIARMMLKCWFGVTQIVNISRGPTESIFPRAELAPDEREIGRKQTLKPRLATLGISTDCITLKHPRPQVFRAQRQHPPAACVQATPSHPRLLSHTPRFASLWQASSPWGSAQKHKRLSLQTNRPDSVHLSVSVQPASPGQWLLLSKY